MTSLALRPALLALALTLAAASPAGAQSADPIEAVWTFSGGQVAVDRQADGSFIGTVIRQTTLATCPHQVGEQMWTEIRAQPDGQYFGRHQYLRDADCGPAERGNTAYRVLRRPDGAEFLRVCFSTPDSPESQPSIAPDGTESGGNDGCRDSELVSRASAPPRLADIVTLPASRGCASRRRFPIRLREPRGDAIKSAVITLNAKRLRVRRVAGRLTTTVDLRGLPRGRYRVKIVAKTYRGQTIQGSRRYRTCGTRRRIGTVGPV